MTCLLSKARIQKGGVVGKAIGIGASVDPLKSTAVEAYHLARIIACVGVHACVALYT